MINILKKFFSKPEKSKDSCKGELILESALSAKVTDINGKVRDLGVISRRLVTTAAVNYMVDSFQNSTTAPLDVMKYHDSGTGAVAEAVGDTALGTPTAEARDIGTQIEGATANIYKTVAEHTYAGAFAITEHGIFSASTVGTLLDRSVFAAINVTSGMKIEFTYELECTAGG